MTVLSIHDSFINTRHFAIDSDKLKSLSSKIQKTASSIGFIQHALFKSLLNSHLLEHRKNLKNLSYSHLHIRTTLRNKIGLFLYRCSIEVLLKSLLKSNILQLKCKNNKLHRFISQKPFKRNNYNIPVVSLSSEELDVEKLRYGLHHSYTNKNKYIKRDIAVEFESLATILDPFVNQSSKETFLEYLRYSTKVIANNVYQDSDNTFKSLNNIQNNSNIIILSVDKETCTVILNRTDYIKKVNAMIDDGISQSKYVETVDNTHQDLKHFQNLL